MGCSHLWLYLFGVRRRRLPHLHQPLATEEAWPVDRRCILQGCEVHAFFNRQWYMLLRYVLFVSTLCVSSSPLRRHVFCNLRFVAGIFVPFFYIVQYSQDQGVSQRLAFDLLSVMNAGSVFGRVLPGYAADLVGRYNMLAPFAVLAGIFSLALWLNAHNVAALTLYSVFYGFFSGAFISLNTPCIAQISRMDQIGTRIGMAYSLLSFPSVFCLSVPFSR